MIDKLKAAFPEAEWVSTETRDYGFERGMAVRSNGRTHAIKVLASDDADAAIATLRRWGAR